ncbi:hypothetical protein [Phytohabitans aurantiacus]|uniref:RES domain-containing protein n=1 Tax=Phytohabitans aurantiacus TaxID=3016789 RepID=A0ABQ5R8K1_9ACTN|nr:hypothetical protein [Phytohabitans aurantiacus]GLI02918.1 hypothetical protein Pa4123_81960 [Phytohabitans aurantiacus]
MVDVTFDVAPGTDQTHIKLQTDTWELNIRGLLRDFVSLAQIRDADWDARRSLAIGTCAGVPVYWASSENNVAILVGQDDETWDIAVTVPFSSVDDIATQARDMIKHH